MGELERIEEGGSRVSCGDIEAKLNHIWGIN